MLFEFINNMAQLTVVKLTTLKPIRLYTYETNYGNIFMATQCDPASIESIRDTTFHLTKSQFIDAVLFVFKVTHFRR